MSQTKSIQEAVQKFLYDTSHIYQALNYGRTGYFEADILAVTKSMMVTEVEVKISRSDFKADFKKTHKHYRMQNPRNENGIATPNRFYYACPIGLIEESEVPAYAGLMWVDILGNVTLVKSAPRIHKDKASEKLIIGMLENLTAKTIFGCQIMTHRARESKALFEEKQCS